ncbi:hypothetical protein L6452_32802 [Arctium lappa]|uniref:Uncharacterized protein n=1 Tax=Arctium lappa TaxID=4217 RepID=A0ACB8Z5J2_ARCLA|nr:hypothetical protein L6452_32802 [Arctium lappa]
MFRTFPEFSKFGEHTLSHHNHHIEVSAVELSFTGASTRSIVKSVINYAYWHNVRQLILRRLRFSRKVFEFPQCLFTSHTLEHVTLATKRRCLYAGSCVPNSAWDFSALETLNFRNQQLSDQRDASLDLFFKCMNLTCLTLHRCSMFALRFSMFVLHNFLILQLQIPDSFPEVFHLVAPQLKNLTASVQDYDRSFSSVVHRRLGFSRGSESLFGYLS